MAGEEEGGGFVVNVCPEEIRTDNRRKELARIRRTREYREIVSSLTAGRTCIWCGRIDHLTIHHVSLWSYMSERAYIEGLYTGWVMCTSCHRAYHSGRILCPECKTRYTKYTTCYACMPQERKDEIVRKKIQKKKLLRMLRKKARDRFLERIKQ